MAKKKEKQQGVVKSIMHPTSQQRTERKNVIREEFERYVRKCGNGAHIGISKYWVNKYVKVSVEEIIE